MNISTRERFLLIVMGIALALFLSYRLLVKPLMDEISQADTDIAAAMEQRSSLDIAAAGKKAMENKNAELDIQIKDTLAFFYPKLETKAVYKFLNDSVTASGLAPSGVNLSPLTLSYPETRETADDTTAENIFYNMAQQISGSAQLSDQDTGEQTQDNTSAASEPVPAEAREVQISFNGTYQGLRTLLSTLERQEKSILISSFNFEQEESFDGSLSFTFYAVPKPFEDDTGFPRY